MHSIHGRAPAIATGVATAREDLAVFVITGDGDALSIGGNHLIHVLRRNVNLTILLFNNRIYGLTKGQYSPTSEIGKVTKSTPMGSLDNPFNPVSLALGAEATFVARTIDSDRKHLTAVLKAAADHRGTSFVEIYQNCPIFNDDAFAAMKDPATSADAIIPLTHGEPIRFGADGHLGVVRDRAPASSGWSRWPRSAWTALVVHDAHLADPSFAFGLSRLTDAGVLHRAPIGIFRDVDARRTTTWPASRSNWPAATGTARTTCSGDQRRRHLAGPLIATAKGFDNRPVGQTGQALSVEVNGLSW